MTDDPSGGARAAARPSTRGPSSSARSHQSHPSQQRMDPMTARTRTRLAALLAAVRRGAGRLRRPRTTRRPHDPSDPRRPSSRAHDRPTSPTSDHPVGERQRQPGRRWPCRSTSSARPRIGPRLFREFRNVEADNPVDEALALMTAGDALDPDYRTLLPGGELRRVESSDGRARSWSSSPTTTGHERPDGMSAKEAKLAVQQLVYTVQGVAAGAAPGRVRRSTATARRCSASTPPAGFKAARRRTTCSRSSTSPTPEEGATVSGTFTASGRRATPSRPPCRGRSATRPATTVLEGFATAEGWGDQLYPWESRGRRHRPGARHLHVRRADRRPVRRRGRRPDRGHQDASPFK